jgi:hypothetical protein
VSKNIAYGVIYEEGNYGYFITIFDNKDDAERLIFEIHNFISEPLITEESAIIEKYFLSAKKYKINTINDASYNTPCNFLISNGNQNIYTKKIDLNEFDLDLFWYERRMCISAFEIKFIDSIKSEVNRDLISGFIPN